MCLSCIMYLIPVTILHMLHLLCATKRRNILTLVLFEKLFLNETKNHILPPPPPPPPVQVKWSVPYVPHSCDNTSYATSSSSSSFTTENLQLDECYFPAHAWHDNVLINFHFCNFVFFFLFSIR